MTHDIEWIIYGILQPTCAGGPHKLVYVGLTGDFSKRRASHRSIGYKEDPFMMFEIERHNDEEIAKERERELVFMLQPCDNAKFKNRIPGRGFLEQRVNGKIKRIRLSNAIREKAWRLGDDPLPWWSYEDYEKRVELEEKRN